MSGERPTLEVGKTYLNGLGERVHIRASAPSLTDRSTIIFEAENTWNYDICGYLFFNEGEEDPRHLVSEAPSSSSIHQLTLEVGKAYLCGRGTAVTIMSKSVHPTDSSITIFNGDDDWSYSENGRWSFDEKPNAIFDLISEITSSPVTSADLSDKHLGGDPRVTSVLKTMMDFPVLSGRVTRRHAELIIERLDNGPPAPPLELGKSYLTGDDRVITIAETIGEEEFAYTRGYRFVDGQGVYLTDNGQHNLHSRVIRDVVREVINMADERIQGNRDGVLDDLGYLAAMGRVISAIKLYRSIYGGGLVRAKAIINEAAASARKRYTIPVVSSGRRAEELEQCLEETRKLVSRCAVNGFADKDAFLDLYRNNGAISRLIPMTPAKRQSFREDLDQKETEIK